METSDIDDWQLALAGDGEAFGRIFDKYAARIHRHGIRLVEIRADAEDVVALTFLHAWRKREDVRFVNESLLPWLLVVATNSARNLSRSARRYDALLRRIPPSNIDETSSPVELSDAEMALETLSLAHKQVLILCVIENFSEQEAASVLAVPEGTVKSRLSRAKKKLAEALASEERGTLLKRKATP